MNEITSFFNAAHPCSSFCNVAPCSTPFWFHTLSVFTSRFAEFERILHYRDPGGSSPCEDLSSKARNGGCMIRRPQSHQVVERKKQEKRNHDVDATYRSRVKRATSGLHMPNICCNGNVTGHFMWDVCRNAVAQPPPALDNHLR